LNPEAHNANAAEMRRELTDTDHSQYFFSNMEILHGQGGWRIEDRR
jgi:hypothetical protein